MRSKKLLTLLLVICMVVSCMTPAAAVLTGSETIGAPAQTESNVNKDDSGNESSEKEPYEGGVTLKDTQDYIIGTTSKDKNPNTGSTAKSDGYWYAQKSDNDVNIEFNNDALSSVVEGLENYDENEKVTIFVILEGKALVEDYSSINNVPSLEVSNIEVAQNNIIQAIQNNVLGGNPVDVVDQFNYLTNAIVIDVEAKNVGAIAELPGVKTVFISPVFYPASMDPATVSSGQMTGVEAVWETEGLGYTGEGMTIAILDTGLDLDHPSFAAAPANNSAHFSADDIAAMLASGELAAAELYNQSTGKTLTVNDLYYSEKVPFRFNYATGTNNVDHKDVGDHGTHVAGISAANAVEGTGVVGMAPNAQIIVMKVFSPSGGAGMVAILNALEDCMRMGVDVANLSLGSPAGFTATGVAVVDEIFASIKNTDLIVDIAAGNEGTSAYGSLWDNYLNTTENPDTATVSSPATYANAMSVGSVDNNYVVSEYFTVGEEKIFYQPSLEYLYAYTDISLLDLAGETVEYVIVPGLGTPEDFAGVDVEGKVAVVFRGEISFSAKVENALAAGAIAVIIWNNNNTENIFNFGMGTTFADGSYSPIPVVLITMSDGQIMADAAEKTMYVSPTGALRMDSHGGEMSSFSSWGVSPDLGLLPDISGIGGNVYSCYDGGRYGLMSGTSMATPQVAGVTALVLQYIESTFTSLSISEKRTLVDALMMSTATPVIDSTTGLEASPRQQGAGLVNAIGAVSSEAYITVNGGRPKAELGDNASGIYSFSFAVTNYSNTDKTYEFDASLLCEAFITDKGEKFMAEYEHALDASAVSISTNSPYAVGDDTGIIVAAGGTANVTVSISLTASDKAWIDANFPNGNYVEGFIYLKTLDEGGVDLSLPFLGFYGDWAQAPIFDHGFWYENGFWDGVVKGVDLSKVDAHQFYTVPWINLGSADSTWVLGFNPYTGGQVDEDGNMIYNSDNNVISPNGDGLADYISNYYISMMRNARSVFLTYRDEEDNIVDEEELEYIPKTMYMTSYDQTVPFIYSWYYSDPYDFTDAEGNPLPNGTKLTLEVTGVVDGEGTVQTGFEIPITVDTAAPELRSAIHEHDDKETGKKYLEITVTDEALAYVVLMNKSGTQIYDEISDVDFSKTVENNYIMMLDVTGLGTEFYITLCDYGCNEATYKLEWTNGDNAPEMDTTALYAYQVYDEEIGFKKGSDYMYGWATINKTTTQPTMISSDAYEYYAINAAEYAGGYVFAVDAGGNFLHMIPGIWNRNIICNIGYNVVDMAFDDVTDTMYIILSDSESGTYALATIDLLTGELNVLREYNKYGMPWAMTFVDGKLYCCKFYYNGFFKVDLEGETYDLTAVTTADGSNFVPKNAAGKNVSPNYAQSMTYSKADGKIYWAYYSGTNCELITIDPATWTATAVAMDVNREYVGVLTLEPTDYTVPEATEVIGISLSDEEIILGSGEEYTLSAYTLPWNVTGAVITWTSDDEEVAVVDENGTVTAIGEGITYINAECGDAYAYCLVNIIDINGTLNAFDYYSGDAKGYGGWLEIDMATMKETVVAESPVEFLAADYNGHNGMVYGFDEFGQCYVYDPATGDCSALGTSNGCLVADMAYDYSTGYMYAIVYDANAWSTTLYYVNMNNGKLVEVSEIMGYILITLACDTYGTLYAISYEGYLCTLDLMPTDMGGEIAPWSITIDGEEYDYVATPIMATPVEGIYYAQSMCYDHNNDAIIWANPETGNVFWLDFNTGAFIALGDPSNSGVMEYLGLYVVPEEVTELDEFPVEEVVAEDLLLLTDASKEPVVSVYPLNCNVPYTVEYSGYDESIVSYEDGVFTALKTGTTEVTMTVECGEETFEAFFTVTVKESTGSLYAYLMQDVASYDGYVWVEIPDSNPVNYGIIDYVLYNDVAMTLYSAEYVDGYIYAYGYDDQDWSANFQFLKIDADTMQVVDGIDMGNAFPFVYDMAFDYTTGAMLALAGTSTSTNLYYVNLNNGELIEAMLFDEQMFLSIAVDAEGNIYLMEQSFEFMDPLTWESEIYSALMYMVDLEEGYCDAVMDTGVISNMITSMTYDYDTGYIYWASMDSSYNGALHLIDLDEMALYTLGTIGVSASEITGLMSFSENYPEVPSGLTRLALTETSVELSEGETAALEVFTLPATADATLVWTSSDESVATVDENGVVTAVAAGSTVITVSAQGTKHSATCRVVVYGEEGYFITYNYTDGGFSKINRPVSSFVVNVTEGETEPGVTAMEMVNGYIFAYDENGDLFITSEDDEFERTYIGNHGIEVDESTEVNHGSYIEYTDFTFAVRDLAWDAANDRLLAVGCYGALVDNVYTAYDYSYTDVYELTGGCRLYEVDMATGALVELCVIGAGEDPESGVLMLTVTDDGQAYIYSNFMDWVSTLDTETGAVSNVSTLQNQGVYGSSDGDPMAMVYDATTNLVYMLFTSNGNFYQMFTFNVDTGAFSKVGYVGEYEDYTTDHYAGIVLNEEHVCEYENEHLDPTCTKAGYDKNDCPLCGFYTEIPALGHNYVSHGDKLVCSNCGHTMILDIPTTPSEPDEPSTPVEPDPKPEQPEDVVVESNTTTETVENEDGSVTETTTTTEKKESTDGTVTESTTVSEKTEHTDGSVTETTVVNEKSEREDGTVVTAESTTTTTVDANGKEETVTEAAVQVELSDKAVEENTTGTVTLPIAAVEVAPTTVTTVTVAIPETTESVKVEIPLAEVSETSVVVLVHEDGTEEVVQKASLTDNGLAFTVSENVTVKVVDNTKEFSDVDDTDWYSKAVNFASSRGILNGMGGDEFSPETNMTRGQLAQMLYALESKPEVTTSGTFTDTNNVWYSNAVEWAAENDIISGIGGGAFGGNVEMTREQLVTFLYRYAGKPEYETSDKQFGDSASVSSWAQDAMGWAIANGLISGMDGKINPQGTATRGQVAQVLMNFINKVL